MVVTIVTPLPHIHINKIYKNTYKQIHGHKSSHSLKYCQIKLIKNIFDSEQGYQSL